MNRVVIVKVVLNSINNAKDLVMIAEKTPCEVNLHCNRYIVNAKSILGVLSLPFSKCAEMHFDTEDQAIINPILKELKNLNLLEEDIDIKPTIYDISALGEILIDFTNNGINGHGQKIFTQNPGGAPANVLVAATKLGSKAAFLGKAGDDMHGVFLKKTLENESIDTEGLMLDQNFFTTLAFVDLDESGERTFSFFRKPGADTQIQSEEINLEILENSRIFHVGSLSLTNNPSHDATFYAVKYAKQHDAIISYDPNYRASLWESEEVAKRVMRSMIPYVDIMKISDTEMELLTDKTNPAEATRALCDQGVKIAVVTLGKDGAFIGTKDGGQHVAGFSSEVVDTTGAGDAFWGGFLHSIAHSTTPVAQMQFIEIENHTRLANAVASLCVESLGAIPAMPTKEAVCSRIIGLA